MKLAKIRCLESSKNFLCCMLSGPKECRKRLPKRPPGSKQRQSSSSKRVQSMVQTRTGILHDGMRLPLFQPVAQKRVETRWRMNAHVSQISAGEQSLCIARPCGKLIERHGCWVLAERLLPQGM